MHRRVALAFLAAGLASGVTGLDLGLDKSPVGLGLAHEHAARRGADIRTIKVGTDAVTQVSDHVFGQTSVGATAANLGALETGFYTLGQRAHFYAALLWMGT